MQMRAWLDWLERSRLVRQVILYRGEDGYWVVECPSLPGCISQGKTREEAIRNITDAIRLYVSALPEGVFSTDRPSLE
jgi:predicted RNase H-like HicB family nuclease